MEAGDLDKFDIAWKKCKCRIIQLICFGLLFCNCLEYSIVSLDNRVHVLTYSHNFTRRTLFVFILVMATSFQNRRKNKPFGIKGTRILAPSNLLLTSSGVSSLDNLLGGGIAVGSIILIGGWFTLWNVSVRTFEPLILLHKNDLLYRILLQYMISVICWIALLFTNLE